MSNSSRSDSMRPHPDNVAGDWFVDLRCIDCGTCRQLAPTVFGEFAAYAGVIKQPETDAEVQGALRALVCCPTGSVSTHSRSHVPLIPSVIQEFPMLVAPGVYYCGFSAEESFGASSWLIQHPEGNWLIDTPRFSKHLISSLEALGGIQWIFLTHRDDVGEANRFAEHFGAERIIHHHERLAQPDAEHFITGFDSIKWSPDFTIIPTPGHTKGHCVLYYQNMLFSGDHLWWNITLNRLRAGRSVCWYSWSEQIESVRKLLDLDLEWILPGHGAWIQLSSDKMQTQLHDLISWMEQS